MLAQSMNKERQVRRRAQIHKPRLLHEQLGYGGPSADAPSLNLVSATPFMFLNILFLEVSV
jgi:hypothetical protein